MRALPRPHRVPAASPPGWLDEANIRRPDGGQGSRERFATRSSPRPARNEDARMHRCSRGRRRVDDEDEMKRRSALAPAVMAASHYAYSVTRDHSTTAESGVSDGIRFPPAST